MAQNYLTLHDYEVDYTGVEMALLTLIEMYQSRDLLKIGPAAKKLGAAMIRACEREAAAEESREPDACSGVLFRAEVARGHG